MVRQRAIIGTSFTKFSHGSSLLSPTCFIVTDTTR